MNLAEIGTTIKPTPATENVTDVLVAPIITNASTDFNIEVKFSKLFISFYDSRILHFN